ncbi:MAG: Trp family transcriptional regulator [Patescibacteria group bacterium]
MVNVSKKKLKKDVLNQINNRLVETVAMLKTNDSTKNFINDLLGESEKIVLAKRLSVVFMLQENISWYRISTLLKVSDTTVKKIAMKIDNGEYENILNIVKQKKSRITFWAGMDIVLRAGMPPIVGKGRWSFLDELYGKYNIKK